MQVEDRSEECVNSGAFLKNWMGHSTLENNLSHQKWFLRGSMYLLCKMTGIF